MHEFDLLTSQMVAELRRRRPFIKDLRAWWRGLTADQQKRWLTTLDVATAEEE